jgi:hypothetical protein
MKETPRLHVFERIRQGENERRRYVIATARTLWNA